MKLGVIGCGNMATAILSRVVDDKFLSPGDIICYDVNDAMTKRMAKEFGVQEAEGNLEVASTADALILSVKPQFYAPVIEEIRDAVSDDCCIITMAPGKSLKWISEKFGKPQLSVIRTMPNTPAMVGEGMTALCPGEYVTNTQLSFAKGLFEVCGKTDVVAEYLMDAVVAVSGSSPAYIYIAIEAMADGAVAQGMPRAQAYKFASQAVLGSAKMVLESGVHPGALKDAVCSPGGTTIAAVSQLEKSGFRAAILSAMEKIKEVLKGS